MAQRWFGTEGGGKGPEFSSLGICISTFSFSLSIDSAAEIASSSPPHPTPSIPLHPRGVADLILFLSPLFHPSGIYSYHK